MTVQDILIEIQENVEKYGQDFLNWKVYTEQITELDKICKRGEDLDGFQKDWGHIKDSEGWEYIACTGFFTKFPKEKIFTVNVNF